MALAYVKATQEVWVTTPAPKTITVLDVASPGHPKLRASIPLSGKPEGYAVDGRNGRFFTNLEDQNLTLIFDVHTRETLAKFSPGAEKTGRAESSLMPGGNCWWWPAPTSWSLFV